MNKNKLSVWKSLKTLNKKSNTFNKNNTTINNKIL